MASIICGYFLSVLIEGLVLWCALSPRHSRGTKVFASFWLTACTYPIVIVAMPVFLAEPYYTLVAEVFAAAAECVLFAWLVGKRWGLRDMVAVVGANAASFAAGFLL